MGPRECDCSKDPCCDNGVPARGADGVEGRVRAGRVSGGLTWVLGLTGLVWRPARLGSRWLNCVGLICFYFGDGYSMGLIRLELGLGGFKIL